MFEGALIPILMYHQVTQYPSAAFAKYTVTARAFGTQMRVLARMGHIAITLDTLIEHRAYKLPLPKRSIVITFDDGFQECVDYAAPVLQRHGFTAIFYLVAGLMGRPSTWLEAECGMVFPLIDWDTARQIERDGLICGAHTMTHPRLATVDAPTCRAELSESRSALEDQLGHVVRHLAYPFGSYNEATLAIAADVGFRSACSTQKGRSGPGDHPLALHRVPIYGHDTLLDFICRLHTTRSIRELTRDAVRQMRKPRFSAQAGGVR